MLKKLFKPKWQYDDASIRKAAIKDLDAKSEGLKHLALEDKDLSVRLSAIEKLTDEDSLFAIANRDDEAAYAGTSRLITLSTEQPLSIEANTIAVQIDPSEHDIDELTSSLDSCIRATALQLPLDNSRLFELAACDNDKNIRQQAIKKLTDDDLLKSLVKQYKGKDKTLFRLAQNKLEANAEKERELAALNNLIEQTNQLTAEAGNIAQAKLKAISHQFAQINNVPEPIKSKFNLASQNVTEYINDWQIKQSIIAPQIEMRKTLIERAKASIEDIAAGKTQVESPSLLHDTWLQLEPVDDDALRLTFDELLETLHNQYKTFLQNQSRLKQLESYLEQLEKEFTQNLPRRKRIETLQNNFKQALRPSQSEALFTVEQKFSQTLQQALKKTETVHALAKIERTEIKDQLKLLKESIATDDTAQAETQFNQLKVRIGNAPISGKERQSYLTELNQHLPDLKKLRSWRSFGANQVRKELIQQAKNLLTSTLPANKLAKEVGALRNQWKNLNTQDYAGGKDLWEEFNTACNTVYALCEQDFGEQATEQKKKLLARERLCEQLEDISNKTDWSHVDWRETDKTIRHIRDAWKKSGAVHRRDWNKIADRFFDALRKVEAHLKPEQERNKKQRETLIEKIRALTDNEETQAAIEEVKHLQEQWRVTVASHPRIEQKLWDDFKTAQNAIFNKRREENQANRAEIDSHIKQRDKLLTTLNTLANLAPVEAMSEKKQAKQIESDWKNITSIPLKIAKEQDKKFGSALRRYEKKLEQALFMQKIAELDKLIRHIESPISHPPEFIDKTWNKALEEPKVSLDEQRLRLIEMELLLKITSPQEESDLRAQKQIELLQSAMATKAQGSQNEHVLTLLIKYYLHANTKEQPCNALLRLKNIRETLIIPPHV